MRQQLLSEILWFVPAVARLRGIRRIALLGSMTTEKKDPKDIDFLVVVDDEVSLEPLAKIGRKIKGHAQNIGRGADIFLANARGRYIGHHPKRAARLGTPVVEPVIGYDVAQAYAAPATRCIVGGGTIFTMI